MRKNSKAIGGTVGGAIGVLIVWALKAFSDVDVPPEAAAAIATICSAILVWFAPANQP